MTEQSSRMLRRVVALIQQPEVERTDEEMEALIPWLAKIATPFHALEKDKLMTLLRFCNYKKVSRDHVIIRQGDTGDCFHVMLSGKSSLYIDMGALDDLDKDCAGEGHGVKADADNWEEVWDRSGKRCLRLDRSKFGGYITSFEAGKGFGEMALIDPRCIRSGSIIADEDCELLVIDQRLFNDTLKERQEAERKNRWAFIESSPLFSNWQSKMKRLLDMSLVQKVYPFDCFIVRQGQPVTGLHFIIRGEALVTLDPRLHPHQYPKVFDRRMEILNELNKNPEKKEAPSKKDSQFLPEQIRRPEVGHVTAQRRPLSTNCQNICAIDQSEVIGALELVLGLDTYAQNVVSKTELEVFVLDNRSIDRLFNRTKHTSTTAYLVERVQERLKARLTFGPGSKVELYRHLSSILDERKWKRETQDRKSRPNKDISAFLTNKSDSADPNLRGALLDDRTGQQAAGPDEHQRLVSGRKSTDPNSNPAGHSPPLTAYYKSKVMHRTKHFSRAYLHSREGGYGRQHTGLTDGGRRLVMDRATRLLPRSRRELEHVALGLKEAKPRPKKNQYNSIQRYLSSPQTVYIDPEKLDLVRALIQETVQADDARASDAAHPSGTDKAAQLRGTVGFAQSSGTDRNAHSTGTLHASHPHGTVRSAHPGGTVPSAHSSGTGGGRRSSESEEEDTEVILGLEETVINERLRNVVLKIGDYHQELNEQRKQSIFFSVFDSRRVSDKKQSIVSKMARPKMTPGSTKICFDKESSDETLTLVEDRLRRFYSGFDTRDNDSPVVQQLRRFRVTAAEDAPIPAGTVYVCRRNHDNATSRCDSNLSNEVYGETGETGNNRPKIRRYMIPKTAYPLLINALPKHDMEGEKELRKQSCIS